MDRVYSVYLSNETSATGEPTWSGVYDKPDFSAPAGKGRGLAREPERKLRKNWYYRK